MTLKEMREKRAKAIADARAIKTKADGEKREMTAEELGQLNGFMDEADTLKGDIAKEERAGIAGRLDEAEKELEASAGRKTETKPPAPGREAEGEDRSKKDFEIEIRGKKYTVVAGTPMHRRNQPDNLKEFRRYVLDGERRNLQSDLDSAGGFLITPELVVAEFIKNLDDEVLVRGLARKFILTEAASLGARTREGKLTSFARGSELGEPTDDTTLSFGKRSLTPTYMTGSIVVSRDLLRFGSPNPESMVMEELARDAGELEEREFISGHGASEPLGLFTASNDGIPTTRDVSTGNAATAIGFDGLIRAKMSLKKKYRNNATWMFHRDAITQIMLIKDGNGQYIYKQSVIDAQTVDTLLGRPVEESEWVPNTYTAGLYAGIIGDFQWYWIVDQLMLEIQRLNETKARSNQVEFIARRKNDGAPMKAEAFARVKLGA